MPRLKISGELKAKIEHLELKKQMRVDEIRILDRELVEKREEKRRFEEIRCSLEKGSEGNEPKRQKISNNNSTIPKISWSNSDQDVRETRRGGSSGTSNGGGVSPAHSKLVRLQALPRDTVRGALASEITDAFRPSRDVAWERSDGNVKDAYK